MAATGILLIYVSLFSILILTSILPVLPVRVNNLIVLLSSSKVAVHAVVLIIVTAYWPVVGVPLTEVNNIPFLYIY